MAAASQSLHAERRGASQLTAQGYRVSAAATLCPAAINIAQTVCYNIPGEQLQCRLQRAGLEGEEQEATLSLENWLLAVKVEKRC